MDGIIGRIDGFIAVIGSRILNRFREIKKMTKQDAYELVESFGGIEEVEWLVNNNLMYVLNPNHDLNIALKILKGDEND
ncbi:hypothetical protein BRC2024_OQYPJBKP_CDS_0028 [Acinetobacter phage vB_AbaM_Highwayman]|uniref:Uncharacterized protein n=5 Tax=root TaxID=1 RepID=A0A1V0DZE1_9CAUD|nr:hypothetical protein [Escherichia coli]YP_009600555.1 hypothetical protein FDH41_gp61 [Acinetobacter phage WCHABP12]YP_009604539.1 hypothetical protein FDH91_gp48 [Acinetobacter phage WCHABP1]AYP69035.1 hypothetical protein [Acinetobacter phage vB_AbaM_IME512]QEA11014.1 hypothetical protein Abp9_14 [Acinetobacter phage Abp9]WMC00216.1 hypothetical protein [Acinetobacter phage Ab31]WMC00515.1 hypothetical protein [Acinetobacter phage Ab59]WMC00641.1 hypothetical protein [Acinetobacter phag